MDHPSPDIQHGTHKTYIVGFILCVLLTLLAYFSVSLHLFSRGTVLAVVTALALIQFVVQMVLFLHLGTEKKPHWNLMTFFFMILVILIIAGGSLLIMFSLNERVMPEMVM